MSPWPRCAANISGHTPSGSSGAFTSASRSQSSETQPPRPWYAATCSIIGPPAQVAKFASTTPNSRSMFTIAVWPARVARVAMLWPSTLAPTEALCSSSSEVTSTCPLSPANMIADRNRTSTVPWRAPMSSRHWQIREFPWCAAMCSAVTPSTCRGLSRCLPEPSRTRCESPSMFWLSRSCRMCTGSKLFRMLAWMSAPA
mmetsp:Transcript_38596/g.109086  ORF Transcript_38596/g.109086 Transcript_38596/m.109086 type:complete len:200 (-) Transcript_38596:142-741(-)